MKQWFTRTYKIGKLSISFLSDEIIFIYRGRKNVSLRKVPRHWFSPRRQLLYGTSFLFVLLCLVLFLPFGDRYDDKESLDDLQKEEILLSSETDFTTPEKPETLQIRYHKVQQGETLSEIAKQYGVSMDTVCGCNNLVSYDIIRVGAILRIPNKDGILHTMKKGQNLPSIAKKYRVSIKKIISENELANPDFIASGHDVFVPDAKPLNIIPGFLWPAANTYITSGYGWRRHPINRRRQFHHGIDIRSKYQWVRSTKYGKVTFTGWLGGYGRAVVIAHPGGWKSLYGHLSRIVVRRGQYVKQGQIVARSGNTGYSSGPHLHFELLKNGRHVNPYHHLNRR